MYPETKTELYREYKALRKRGLKVKGFWFKMRAKQLLERIDPEASFNFLDRWFDSFKKRHRITFRRSTNVCQKPADDKKSAVRSFHKTIREIACDSEQTGQVGRFELHQVANVDHADTSLFLFCRWSNVCRHWRQHSLGQRRRVRPGEETMYGATYIVCGWEG